MKLSLIFVAVAATISLAFGAVRSKDDRCRGVVNSIPEYEKTEQVAQTEHAERAESVLPILKGCRLLDVEPNSIYAKLGLAKGDLVRPNEMPESGTRMEIRNDHVVEATR